MLRDASPSPRVTYSRQFRRCNKPDCPACRSGGRGHGPYWYVYWREEGRLRSRYLGRSAPPEAGAGLQVVAPATAPIAPPDAVWPPVPTPGAFDVDEHYPPLRVRTLGSFAVWRGADAVVPSTWARRRVAALFKALLSAPGQRMQRENALEILWPDEDPAVSRKNLRLTLHRLRRALGETGGGQSYVRTDGDMLLLMPAVAPEPDWLDAAAFERAATAALAGRDVARCQDALALYTGDYLPDDLYEEWAVGPREALRHRYLTLLLHVAVLHERQGMPHEAERCLRTILETDPSHEPATRALMRVQSATGQFAEALRTYRRLVVTLRQEFELAPDVETQAQYQALLTAQAAAAARRTNLPSPVTSFIGRGQELATLTALLGRTSHTAAPDDATAVQCRMLTLTGTGGCGKTRLALALGRSLLDIYPDGVWVVELAAVTDATLIVPEVCRVLGVVAAAQQPLLESLVDGLAGRELLLILDNCEHLLDGCVRLAAALLGACPYLSLLVTSREALGMMGETVWRVPSLAVPDARRLPVLADLMRFASIRLFMERAQAVRPGFTLTSQNSRAVATVCRRLDGIPLAIELAAARLAALSVGELATRLDDRFGLLTSGNRAALPRHQTLRAVLDWSYALLDQPERVLLQRLAVFAGGWRLDAAEAVCAGGEVAVTSIADLLDRLVRKSLVQAAEAGTVQGQPRYRLLETVRQYAGLQGSAEDDQRRLRDAHLAWSLALAEHAHGALRGPDRTRWLASLEVEHDNLRLALAWCTGEGQQAESGLRLATALAPFWDCRGYLAEGRAWLDVVLTGGGQSAAKGEEVQRLRCAALGHAAAFAYRQGNGAAAMALMNEGLALARQMGDRGLVADFTQNLGLVYKECQDYEQAAALFEEGMAMDRDRGNHRGVIAALSNLAWVAHARGDYTAETALAEECLARCRARGETDLAPYALGHLANAAYGRGEMDRAAALFRETLAAARDLGVRWGIPICLEGLARVSLRQGRPEQAVCWWGAAAALREEIGAPLSADDRAVYDYDCSIAEARASLSGARFAAGWAAGQRMSEEQVIAAALQEMDFEMAQPAQDA